MRTLKWMAEAGYVMGLSTIGEVASHMQSHHYAYFHTDEVMSNTGSYKEFLDMVAGHEESSIDLWLTPEDKAKIDAEVEAACLSGPGEAPEETGELFDEQETRGEEKEGPEAVGDEADVG